MHASQPATPRLATAPAWQLALVALLVRAVVGVSMLAVNALAPDYDSSMRAAPVLGAAPDAVLRWDAVHYAHIADHGYTHEHLHAFFPFVPAVLRAARALSGGGPLLEAALLTAYQLATFAVATVALRAVLRDLATWGGGGGAAGAVASTTVNGVVHVALVAWLVSPASVFFSALYTEAPFAAVSFLGFAVFNRFWHREILPPPTGAADRAGAAGGQQNLAGSFLLLTAAIGLFTLAGTIRSNAILLSAHLFHAVCAIVVLRALNHRGASAISRTRAVMWCVMLTAGIAATLTPYLWIIHDAFTSFCHTATAAAVDPLVCGRGVMGFYSGIQSKYWHVGFFTYYTPNNIPNFFLAAPMFVLGFAAVARWFAAAWARTATAGTLSAGGGSGARGGSPSPLQPAASASRPASSTGGRCVAFVRDAVATPLGAHTFYFLGLLLIALTNMHVQVVTRFVAASSPALYSLWARWVMDAEGARRPGEGPSRISRAIASYSCVWACLGVALFSNFMPWT